jgi:four helix bundle protein
MGVQSEQLKQRTMSFALAVLRLIDKVPNTHGGQVVGRQLAKSATSVGANYRASCNARSRLEFIARLGVVVEEIDETLYWLELIAGSSLLSPSHADPVRAEASELRAIFAKSLGTARTNLKMSKSIDQITR